ncbi:phosphomannomutase/phosphoglucomutase [Curvibacter gracilis]|uniref:phosphomannomutase/phosphoglucomutase n=1 Tax=Curvibacter gracilis TaxID=230310 RepID=UPI0004895A24|nr:phosphomannomutase/phosphoglucomutase [Curvibacter gracilis]
MQVNAAIFKAYDIRGIVPTTLNTEVAEALGLAFGAAAQALGEKTVAVGRDGRLSGPSLVQALIRGLVAAGIEVIDVGAVTTPMLYFAASTLCRSGIQVTGSHNPKDYNGFKMVLAGKAIYGDEIQALRRTMEADSAPRLAGGSVREADVGPAYRDRIVGDVKLARPLKIVVDSGNGIAGASAPAIFRALGCEVTELFSEVDGDFPNHHPDPSKPENLRDLMAALQAGDAELGLAFDGDGDRLGIVTKDGQNIFPDRQMMLFARDVLSRVPGGEIVFDVKCTQRLAPEIAAAGGVPVMFKTGHSLIKARMRETNAPLGGEMSGHIFFKERWYGFDDGTYAGCRLLEILSRHPDANAVLNGLPQSHSTPELNVACAEGEPHRVTAELQAAAPEFLAQRATARGDSATPAISAIDGLRVDWADGFGLIRASNTTPVLVLRFEGQNAEALHRIEGDMLALLRQIKPDAQVGSAAH